LEPLFLFLVGWIGAAVIGLTLTAARVNWIPVLAALDPHRLFPTTREAGTVSDHSRTGSPREICPFPSLSIGQVPRQSLTILTAPVIPLGTPSVTVVSLSCPTCGLQAPETLMREHFLGSPIHEYRASKPLPVTIVSTGFHTVARPVEEENDRTSLGDLLQTLNVMERLLKRDFYRHELRVGSGISARVANIG